jgi:hypothetical protein
VASVADGAQALTATLAGRSHVVVDATAVVVASSAGKNADAKSGPEVATPAVAFAAGDAVDALWHNGRWYTARVLDVSNTGHVLLFDHECSLRLDVPLTELRTRQSATLVGKARFKTEAANSAWADVVAAEWALKKLRPLAEAVIQYVGPQLGPGHRLWIESTTGDVFNRRLIVQIATESLTSRVLHVADSIQLPAVAIAEGAALAAQTRAPQTPAAAAISSVLWDLRDGRFGVVPEFSKVLGIAIDDQQLVRAYHDIVGKLRLSADDRDIPLLFV